MDMSQYLDTFLEEAREHLQKMEQGLLCLENSPDNQLLMDEIFRSAHTVKGMSATMGYTTVAEVTHEMENILHKIRSGVLRLTSRFTDLLLQGVDLLHSMVGDISGGGDGNLPVEDFLSLLRGPETVVEEEVAEHSIPLETVREQRTESPVISINFNQFERNLIMKAIDQGYHCYHLVVYINPSCIMKSARAFMIFKNLELAGEIVKSTPPVHEIEQERFDSSFELIIISGETPEVIRGCLVSITEVEEPEINCISEVINFLPDDTAEDLDNSKQNTAISVVQENVEIEKTGAKTGVSQTIRVDKNKLDNLMNLVGELVISKTRLDRIRRVHQIPDLIETFEQMDRVTSDLQDTVMKIRMVPIESVFCRFPRVVRDLAKELGKDIEINLRGEETELDRTVIDEIGEPLLHLIRNAVDHGIEEPHIRVACGKNQQGFINLSARHEGNNVVIEVEDDGKGIDPEVIRLTAVERGLVTAGEAEGLDIGTLTRFVLAPGFTTTETVTGISGRGVGLDVVRSKIEALGGSLDIRSTPGSGTKFIVRLPLTVAIIQALLVSIESEIFAIPLSFISETMSVMPDEINTVQEQEFVFLRENILPLKRLQRVFQVPHSDVPKEPELNIVVVNKGTGKVGLIVDNLIGQQEIVIKPVSKLFGDIPVIAGATILGDGRVSLIIDVTGLL